MATPASPSDGGAVYGALLKDELAAQEARKASFEQRALAVVTSAGVLVTLIFAFAALTKNGTHTVVLSSAARTFLIIALTLFVTGAIAALITNIPIRYEQIAVSEIRSRLKERPVRSPERADRDIALSRLKVLADAKEKNKFKGRALFTALLLEVMAVLFLAIAVAILVSSHQPKSPTPQPLQGRRGPRGYTGPRGPRGYPAPPDSP